MHKVCLPGRTRLVGGLFLCMMLPTTAPALELEEIIVTAQKREQTSAGSSDICYRF